MRGNREMERGERDIGWRKMEREGEKGAYMHSSSRKGQ